MKSITSSGHGMFMQCSLVQSLSAVLVLIATLHLSPQHAHAATCTGGATRSTSGTVSDAWSVFDGCVLSAASTIFDFGALPVNTAAPFGLRFAHTTVPIVGGGAVVELRGMATATAHTSLDILIANSTLLNAMLKITLVMPAGSRIAVQNTTFLNNGQYINPGYGDAQYGTYVPSSVVFLGALTLRDGSALTFSNVSARIVRGGGYNLASLWTSMVDLRNGSSILISDGSRWLSDGGGSTWDVYGLRLSLRYHGVGNSFSASNSYIEALTGGSDGQTTGIISAYFVLGTAPLSSFGLFWNISGSTLISRGIRCGYGIVINPASYAFIALANSTFSGERTTVHASIPNNHVVLILSGPFQHSRFVMEGCIITTPTPSLLTLLVLFQSLTLGNTTFAFIESTLGPASTATANLVALAFSGNTIGATPVSVTLRDNSIRGNTALALPRIVAGYVSPMTFVFCRNRYYGTQLVTRAAHLATAITDIGTANLGAARYWCGSGTAEHTPTATTSPSASLSTTRTITGPTSSITARGSNTATPPCSTTETPSRSIVASPTNTASVSAVPTHTPLVIPPTTTTTTTAPPTSTTTTETSTTLTSTSTAPSTTTTSPALSSTATTTTATETSTTSPPTTTLTTISPTTAATTTMTIITTPSALVTTGPSHTTTDQATASSSTTLSAPPSSSPPATTTSSGAPASATATAAATTAASTTSVAVTTSTATAPFCNGSTPAAPTASSAPALTAAASMRLPTDTTAYFTLAFPEAPVSVATPVLTVSFTLTITTNIWGNHSEVVDATCMSTSGLQTSSLSFSLQCTFTDDASTRRGGLQALRQYAAATSQAEGTPVILSASVAEGTLWRVDDPAATSISGSCNAPHQRLSPAVTLVLTAWDSTALECGSADAVVQVVKALLVVDAPAFGLLIVDPTAVEAQLLTVLLLSPCASRSHHDAAAITQYLLSPLAGAGARIVVAVHTALAVAAVGGHLLLTAYLLQQQQQQPGRTPNLNHEAAASSGIPTRVAAVLAVARFPGPSFAFAMLLYPGAAHGTAILARSGNGAMGGADAALVAMATILFLIPLPALAAVMLFRVAVPHAGSSFVPTAAAEQGQGFASPRLRRLRRLWTPIGAWTDRAGLERRGLWSVRGFTAPRGQMQAIAAVLIFLVTCVLATSPKSSSTCRGRLATASALFAAAAVAVAALRPYTTRLSDGLTVAAYLGLCGLAAAIAAGTSKDTSTPQTSALLAGLLCAILTIICTFVRTAHWGHLLFGRLRAAPNPHHDDNDIHRSLDTDENMVALTTVNL